MKQACVWQGEGFPEPPDTALDFEAGDLARDAGGIPFALMGEEAFLQRVRLALRLPLGSFPYGGNWGCSAAKENPEGPKGTLLYDLEEARKALAQIPEAEPLSLRQEAGKGYLRLGTPWGLRELEWRR